MHGNWILSTVGTAVLAATLAVSPALGDGGGGGGGGDYAGPSKLAPVHEVIALGDFATAVEKLEVLRAEEPEDADVLNLLGFSHRKQGRYAQALEFYQAALRIDPDHRGANEYLGELYLETGELAKAEERLQVLDRECFFPCREYSELKASIKAYKQDKGIN